GDPATGELLADGVEFAGDGNRAGGVDGALDFHGCAAAEWGRGRSGRRGGRRGRAGGAGRWWGAGGAGGGGGGAPGLGGPGREGRQRRSSAGWATGRGVNRSAGVAMSRDWCGRRVLYSVRQVSTAVCAASRLSKGPCGSSSSSWMV